MARPGVALFAARRVAGPPPHPLTYLTDVQVWIEAAQAYVSGGSGGPIFNFTNRGNLGSTCPNINGWNYAGQVQNDPNFGGKNSWGGGDKWGYNTPNLATAGRTSFEKFVVGMHAPSSPSNGGGGFDMTGASGGYDNAIPNAAGTSVSDNFAANQRFTFSAPSLATFRAPWLIDVRSSSTDWGWRMNGVDLKVQAGNNFAMPNHGAPPFINLGTGSGGTTYFKGWWAIYVICGAVQSAAQRAQMEAWCKQEFALAALP